MLSLKNIIQQHFSNYDEIAALLKTDVESLRKFENAYKRINDSSDNFFDLNAKQVSSMHAGIQSDVCYDVVKRIVEGLLSKTSAWSFDGKNVSVSQYSLPEDFVPVSNEEIIKLPEEIRPELTESLMKCDIKEPSHIALCDFYQRYLKEKNPKKKKTYYDMFRQGLDILDLDWITYEMIGTNPNSMGNWLPQLVDGVLKENFFKIPKTTIIKVPLTMLQLTRLSYELHTRTTLDIVNEFCMKAFSLDTEKEYFIKTGTYSSKFDFRNAHVSGAKEVRELGEYLLFIHHQAIMMASSLNNISIYGVSTTNEWVVREFIPDKENNPSIYKGLPLHTEYRVFVDFDTKQVIGMTPYWRPDVMKQRFGHERDSDSPHNKHDYIIYAMHEETLMSRYYENKDIIWKQVELLLQDINGMSGQWSVDIMQNGNDFWIIDMALAINSALNDCVAHGVLKPVEENWIPELD